MHANRLAQYLRPDRPALEVPSADATGFIACPLFLMPGQVGAALAWQQLVYQLARERVESQQRGARLNYDSPAAWN